MKKQWVKRTMMKSWMLLALATIVMSSLVSALDLPAYAITQEQEESTVLADTDIGMISYSSQVIDQQTNWSMKFKVNQTAAYLRMKLVGVDQISVADQIIQKDEMGWFLLEHVPDQLEYQMSFQTSATVTDIPIEAELAISEEEGSTEIVKLVQEGHLVAAPIEELPDDLTTLPELPNQLSPDEVPVVPAEPPTKPLTPEIETPSNDLLGIQPFTVTNGITNKVLLNDTEIDISKDRTSYASPGDTLTFVAEFITGNSGGDRTWVGTIDLSLYDIKSVKHNNEEVSVTPNENGEFTISGLGKKTDHTIRIEVTVKERVLETLATFKSFIPSVNGNTQDVTATATFNIKPYTIPVLSWSSDAENLIQSKTESFDIAELTSGYETSFYWWDSETCDFALYEIDGQTETEIPKAVAKDDTNKTGTIKIPASQFTDDEHNFVLRAMKGGTSIGKQLTLKIKVTRGLTLLKVPETLSWSGSVSDMVGVVNRLENMTLKVRDSRSTPADFSLTASYSSTNSPFSFIWRSGVTGEADQSLTELNLGKGSFLPSQENMYDYIRTDGTETGILLQADSNLPVGDYEGTITWTLGVTP